MRGWGLVHHRTTRITDHTRSLNAFLVLSSCVHAETAGPESCAATAPPSPPPNEKSYGFRVSSLVSQDAKVQNPQKQNQRTYKNSTVNAQKVDSPVSGLWSLRLESGILCGNLIYFWKT